MDLDYLQQRHDEELQRAEAAESPAARAAHEQLAEQLAQQIDALRNSGIDGATPLTA